MPQERSINQKASYVQIMTLGFALLILTGAGLLCLPWAAKGQPLTFLEALFTSTSACCVTGLSLFDPFTRLAPFGQGVLLLLIQIGGLGFLMVALFLSLMLGRRIGLRERSLLMQSFSLWQIGGVVRLGRRVLLGVAGFELVGAALLLIRFQPLFGWRTGIWYSLFHAVSAFCNAGFDLMGRLQPYSSLSGFRQDPLVILTILGLIVVGGLGFFLWYDLSEKTWHWSRYSLHTKIMLAGTLGLILGGAALFFFSEGNGVGQGLPLGQRILDSLFLSITPRTAGFSNLDLTQLSSGGTFLTILLMLVGAGPGSTGGGMKVTTIAVLLLAARAHVHRNAGLNIFHRRLEPEALQQAAAGAGFYLLLWVTGCFLLCYQGWPLVDSLVETASAIGTVGLSRNLTPQLDVVSQWVIMLLMYGGRVGSLSVVLALSPQQSPRLKNPTETVIVG